MSDRSHKIMQAKKVYGENLNTALEPNRISLSFSFAPKKFLLLFLLNKNINSLRLNLSNFTKTKRMFEITLKRLFPIFTNSLINLKKEPLKK